MTYKPAYSNEDNANKHVCLLHSIQTSPSTITYNMRQERIRMAARVRACNSVNLKPGGITEPLLKIVNVLRIRPGFSVAHSD